VAYERQIAPDRWSSNAFRFCLRSCAGFFALLLSTGAYGPLALYKRPELYAWLALLAALGAPASFYYERRRKLASVFPSDSVLAAASASIVLLLLSVFVWLLAPIA